MRTALYTALAAAVLFPAAGHVATAGGGADDLKLMQGKWAATITEVDGKPASDEDRNLKITLTVDGDRFTVHFEGTELISAGTLKLDATKTPRTVDTTLTAGPFKGLVQRGVYELKGDAMVANFAKPGKDRPTALKTVEGSEQSMVRYVRMKK